VITEAAEALEYFGRLRTLKHEIDEAELEVTSTRAAFAAAKRGLADLLKRRDRIFADAAEDRPLFDRVEAPAHQPAGLVAGEQPGAITGALANTLRPADAAADPDAWRAVTIASVVDPELAEVIERDWETDTLGALASMLSDGYSLEDLSFAPEECRSLRDGIGRFRDSQGWGPEDGIPAAWLAPKPSCRICGTRDDGEWPAAFGLDADSVCPDCRWLKEGPPPAEAIPAAPITMDECREIEAKAKLPKKLDARLAKAEGLLGQAADLRFAAESRYNILRDRWAREAGDDSARPAVAYDLSTARIRLAAAKAQEVAWSGTVGTTRNMLAAGKTDKARATKSAKAKAEPPPAATTDDGHEPYFTCRGCKEARGFSEHMSDVPNVCHECRPLFRGTWDDLAWNALGDLVAGGQNGKIPYEDRLDTLADELFTEKVRPSEAGRRMALAMGWRKDQFGAAPTPPAAPKPEPKKRATKKAAVPKEVRP
jgi:hypothetical protein